MLGYMSLDGLECEQVSSLITKPIFMFFLDDVVK